MLALAFICLAPTAAGAQEKAKPPGAIVLVQGEPWQISHASAESLALDGKRAIRLTAEGDSANGIVGLALAVGSHFETGTIDIDLKGRNIRQRSFLGVAFNVIDEKTFEAIYFRPFNFKADEPMRGRAVQYIAWPVNTWEHLRKNAPTQFEKPVNPVPDPDAWFHATIEVTELQVRVFVNGAKEPSLVTRRLHVGGDKRPLGLFVDSAEGLYANLKVTPSR